MTKVSGDMIMQPDPLARADLIFDGDGRRVGVIYYPGVEEMACFRAWFDQVKSSSVGEQTYRQSAESGVCHNDQPLDADGPFGAHAGA